MSSEQDRLRLAGLLLLPGAIAEVRVLGVPRVEILSGYFDDTEKLAAALAEADKRGGQGVYVTANPVEPALLARRANRLSHVGKRGSTTADKDITRRRWLIVDLDPERPAGISSTDQEHEAAVARAAEVQNALSAEGWPEPALLDSGNGAQLWYPLDLANDDDSRELLRRVLLGLDIRFGGKGVHIDPSVFNAARIVKAAGTTARKGDNIPDRPHRVAQFRHVPDALSQVPPEKLHAMAALVPETPPASAAPSGKGRVDILAFLAAAGISPDEGRPWGDGTLYRLAHCPFSQDHADGAYAIQFHSGAVVVRCHHASCQGKGWRDIRDQFPEAAGAAGVGEHKRRRPRVDGTKSGRKVDPGDCATASAAPASKAAGPHPMAADIAARGEDPFGLPAIRSVFDAAAVGLRVDMNDKNPIADFTDVTLAKSMVDYFAGIYAHERFFAFVRHTYEVLHDAELEKFIAHVIEARVDPVRATARRVDAVRKLVAVLAHRPDEWTNRTFNTRELVVFRNGVLDLPSLTLRAGRPDDYMTMRLNCDWEPHAAAGPIDEFIALLLQPDEVLPFLEFVGYAMVPGAPSQEKYAILLGAGENGKSRLLLVLAALFEGFTASIPFQDLAKNRFEKSNLYGKMVNLVGDMSADLVEDTSVIKTLSGGDVIHADIKFKQPIEFVNRAKSIISSNELFRANDHTWGFYRRAMIFRFLRDFREGGADGDKRDPAVVDRLLSNPDTLPRLAYLGIQAYLRLRQEGRFAESAAMAAAREDFRLANDAVAAFVAEVLIEQPDHDVPKEDLYRAFALWAKTTGRGVVGEGKFWQRWANARPAYAAMARARTGEGRVYVVRNVAVDPECGVVVDGREGTAIPLREAVDGTEDTSPALGRGRLQRSATCYGCGSALSSSRNASCVRCGWLVCEECGSCAPDCRATEVRA